MRPASVVVCRYPENRGLAATLNDVIRRAQADGFTLFARMDADDIAMPRRLALQVDYLLTHPDIDIVGGAIEEIDRDGLALAAGGRGWKALSPAALPAAQHEASHTQYCPSCGKVITYPATPEACRRFFARRDPHAHPAVMIRQSYFDKVGGLYRPEYRKDQDTMLWFDGLRHGTRHANLPEVVLRFRNTDDMLRRRGGTALARQQLRSRLTINRTLHYGPTAYAYALAAYALFLSPVWLKRAAYRLLR